MCNLLTIEGENIDLSHYMDAGCTCLLSGKQENCTEAKTDTMQDKTFEALGREVYRALLKRVQQEHRGSGEWVKVMVEFEV